MVQIVPSILSADFAHLAAEIERVERGGATMLHVDIMDGHFVPNLTIGPPVVESIRKITRSRLDVHLMIDDPDRYAPIFIQAGADQVSVHQEACVHLNRTVRLIQSEGALAGVVLNPATPVAMLDEILDVADYVLVMSVNPGFGGQSFITSQLRKIEAVRKMIEKSGRDIRLEVDGGIDTTTAPLAVSAGADVLVAGTASFKGGPDHYAANIAALKRAG